MSLARRFSIAFGLVAVLALVPLLAWDAQPDRFPAHAHDALGAAPLAAVALGYLAMHAGRGAPTFAWVRAGIVAAAFLAWAVNQLWAQSPTATAWNDAAVALFVIDVVIAIFEKSPERSTNRKLPERGVDRSSASRRK